MNETIDELIADLGRSIVADSEMNSVPWDSFALIIREAGTSGSGYRYFGEDGWEAIAPYDLDVRRKFRELHAAMSAEGADWLVMLVRMRRGDGQLTLDFEYEDRSRWKLNPQGIAGIRDFAMSLRPD